MTLFGVSSRLVRTRGYSSISLSELPPPCSGLRCYSRSAPAVTPAGNAHKIFPVPKPLFLTCYRQSESVPSCLSPASCWLYLARLALAYFSVDSVWVENSLELRQAFAGIVGSQKLSTGEML